MQARLIAYPPDEAATDYPLVPGVPLRLGRAADSGLRIDHASVSRAHADLYHDGRDWHLRDLGSKNGSYLAGVRIDDAPLPPRCWLRVGDVYCEFAVLDAAEVAAGDAAARARRSSAAALTARLDGVQRLEDLLSASLRGVLELAECDRGFVLLADDDALTVRSAIALDPTRLATQQFSGSVGAVQRALAQRCSVVVNDIGSEPWLSGRASVIAAGLGALLCLPLLEGERVTGAIYVDRVGPGRAITTLDLELLEAFVETAALWIATRRGSEQLERAMADWSGIVAAHGKAA